MDEEMDQHQFSISKADLIGECIKCGQPATGSYDWDEHSESKNGYDLTVECVNCHAKFSVRLDSAIIWAWQEEIK